MFVLEGDEKSRKENGSAAVCSLVCLDTCSYSLFLFLFMHVCSYSCRDSEDAFVSERDEKKPGGEWERICRLCDFNPKSSRANAKDVSRMRSILLQLKTTPVASARAQ